MARKTTWYGVECSQASKMIILWESSKNPIPSEKFNGKLVLDISRGKVAFNPERVFKVTSRRSHKVMLDKIKGWIKKYPKLKDYSIQTH